MSFLEPGFPKKLMKLIPNKLYPILQAPNDHLQAFPDIYHLQVYRYLSPELIFAELTGQIYGVPLFQRAFVFGELEGNAFEKAVCLLKPKLEMGLVLAYEADLFDMDVFEEKFGGRIAHSERL